MRGEKGRLGRKEPVWRGNGRDISEWEVEFDVGSLEVREGRKGEDRKEENFVETYGFWREIVRGKEVTSHCVDGETDFWFWICVYCL